jgi:hypothetical protein
MPPQFNGEKTDDVVIKENRMLQANHYLELVSLYYWCAHIAVSIWLMVVCVCVCVIAGQERGSEHPCSHTQSNEQIPPSEERRPDPSQTCIHP